MSAPDHIADYRAAEALRRGCSVADAAKLAEVSEAHARRIKHQVEAGEFHTPVVRCGRCGGAVLPPCIRCHGQLEMGLELGIREGGE